MTRKVFIVSCVFALVGIFLPWFTFNAKVTGYYWGLNVLPYILFQGIYIAVYLRGKMTGLGAGILFELCLLSLPVAYIYKFLTWHIPNITGKVSLMTSLHTVTVGFFTALALVLICVITGTVYLIKRK